jgi:hypothetical protein
MSEPTWWHTKRSCEVWNSVTRIPSTYLLFRSNSDTAVKVPSTSPASTDRTEILQALDIISRNAAEASEGEESDASDFEASDSEIEGDVGAMAAKLRQVKVLSSTGPLSDQRMNFVH